MDGSNVRRVKLQAAGHIAKQIALCSSGTRFCLRVGPYSSGGFRILPLTAMVLIIMVPRSIRRKMSLYRKDHEAKI
jgi:hypothetical protein